MTDETPHPDSGDVLPVAGRDELLARLLEVEPLDELTRRRLVSTAARSSGTAKYARRLLAAAAVVVLVVVGAGVFVALRGTGSDQSAAGRRAELTTPGDASQSADASAPAAASGAASGAVSKAEPAELGDFGELTVAANRDGVLAAAAAPSTPTGTALGPAGRQLANLACAVRGLPAGTTVALGTGTLDATRVVVVVTETPGGLRVVSTVDTGTCRVRPLP
jgi:hypothetical protein